MTRRLLIALLGSVAFIVAACGDPYVKLLKDYGYTAAIPPRAAFGTGTVFRIVDGKEVFVAAPSECFPDLKVDPNPIVLPNSTRSATLNVGASATYTPVPIEQVGGAFGFKTVSKVEITVGDVTGNDLTLEGLQQYLEDRKVSRRCFGYLSDAENRFVLGAARTATMRYHLTGTKDINAKLDPVKLSTVLNASGVVDYATSQDDSFTINQPMYIGYKAFAFRDLGIPQEELNDGITLPKGRFQLVQSKPMSRTTN